MKAFELWKSGKRDKDYEEWLAETDLVELVNITGDSTELISEEWLRNVLCWEHNLDSKEWIPVAGADIAFTIKRSDYYPGVWSVLIEEFQWPIDLRVRGQLRNLCECLGIEVKA